MVSQHSVSTFDWDTLFLPSDIRTVRADQILEGFYIRVYTPDGSKKSVLVRKPIYVTDTHMDVTGIRFDCEHLTSYDGSPFRTAEVSPHDRLDVSDSHFVLLQVLGKASHDRYLVREAGYRRAMLLIVPHKKQYNFDIALEQRQITGKNRFMGWMCTFDGTAFMGYNFIEEARG